MPGQHLDTEDFSEIRRPGPRVRNVLWVLALVFAVYHIAGAGFGVPVQRLHIALHLCGIAIFAFAYYPLVRPERPGEGPNRIPVYDIVLMALAIAALLYLPMFWRGGTIGFGALSYQISPQTLRQGNPNAFDLFFGTVLIAITIEMSRRALGWALPIISFCAIGYALFGPSIPIDILKHPGVDWRQFVNNIYFPSEGIFGLPVWVVSTIVIQFVIFGVIAQRTGLGEFFIDTAHAIAGRQIGGPAKVSVISSALFGSISGSAIANTVSTGSLTIPNMKRLGYPGMFAAAVEAAASAGGQITPPLMGAAAFIMAEFLEVPYTTIVIAAIVPSLMHYTGVYAQVHFTALRLGLAPDATSRLSDVVGVWRRGWRHVFPLAALLIILFSGYTPYMSAFVGISVAALFGFTSWRRPVTLLLNAGFIAFVVAKGLDGSFGLPVTLFLVAASIIAAWRSDDPQPIGQLADALAVGAKYSVVVGVAAAVVGITVGVINTTGVGFRVGFMVTNGAAQMADSLHVLLPLAVPDIQMFLSLVLIAIVCIMMGAGLPTTALYILLATVAQPTLSQLGVPPIASHMFVFYYGIIAELTPPVCTTAFAAAAIAQSPPFRTGVEAFKLGIGKIVVPMVFCYAPSLLLVTDGFTWRSLIQDGSTCAIGVIVMSAGLSRYLFGTLKTWQAAIVFLTGLTITAPGTTSDVVGLALFIPIAGYFYIQKNRRVNSTCVS
ncbi:TRAP transporter 4TM/12TM fusion protein [Rhodobium orientis]|uniref:C4-dicarboxylate ABC transporter permease n=1 Tax=Rhodobium orientis TaxID=34017 RepID=A0A327JPI8_9HYPH|nr:TRAP transporter fused permease subunit [Rhodobium orientis]MBB4301413.1 TRAP transporter 4TM/12TM fusion protein [Rhodobium orientis]MBK5950999.1 C4-dicarboxylate ABC transporter permease [Rhodobium orientis]RAI27635.1 C4-dicarboxylate ABC transporter permease [Rhodobium orientis]